MHRIHCCISLQTSNFLWPFPWPSWPQLAEHRAGALVRPMHQRRPKASGPAFLGPAAPSASLPLSKLICPYTPTKLSSLVLTFTYFTGPLSDLTLHLNTGRQQSRKIVCNIKVEAQNQLSTREPITSTFQFPITLFNALYLPKLPFKSVD